MNDPPCPSSLWLLTRPKNFHAFAMARHSLLLATLAMLLSLFSLRGMSSQRRSSCLFSFASHGTQPESYTAPKPITGYHRFNFSLSPTSIIHQHHQNNYISPLCISSVWFISTLQSTRWVAWFCKPHLANICFDIYAPNGRAIHASASTLYPISYASSIHVFFLSYQFFIHLLSSLIFPPSFLLACGGVICGSRITRVHPVSFPFIFLSQLPVSVLVFWLLESPPTVLCGLVTFPSPPPCYNSNFRVMWLVNR